MKCAHFSALLVAAAAFGCGGGQDAMASIVKNGGFEVLEDGIPVGWTIPECYVPAPGRGRNGTAAVAYTSKTGVDCIKYIMQSVMLEGGKSYVISCWIKTDGESGAKIGMEWFDADGKYAATYSPGLKGANDWTLVTLTSPKLPENLASCNVFASAAYVDKEGHAWFDDFAVVKCEMKPIAGLYTGAYRGVVSRNESFSIKASLNLSGDMLDRNEAVVALRYRGADGEVRTVKPDCLTSDFAEFRLNGADLAQGGQTLVCAVATNGVKAGKATCEIERSERAKGWSVRFDRFGRTLVDGKPFFPLGMYMAEATEKELAAYREAPFNCVMPYAEPTKEVLDRCEAAKLKVIFSLKDAYRHKDWAKKKGIKTEADEEAYVAGRIGEFKTHPAVLAWYIDDESGPEYAGQLAKRRALAEKLDPGHPTWICLYQIHQLESYMDAIDCIGTDPYPVARSPISLAADWTRITFKNTLGVRPVWMVPQAFSWKWYPGGQSGDRMPTADEMRAMSWQMIASGANGLIYYAFHNIRANSGADYAGNWSSVKAVVSEIARFVDVFLCDPGPADAGSVDDPTTCVRTWRRGGETFVLAVNASSKWKTGLTCFPLAENREAICQTLLGAPARLEPGVRVAADIPPWGMTLFRLKWGIATYWH